MATIGKLRQGISDARPWLHKVKGYREIISEFFGKAARKVSTLPFIGDMAKRAVETVEEKVNKATDAVKEAIPESVKTFVADYGPDPVSLINKGLDIVDGVSADIQSGMKAVNNWAKENQSISNMILDKPLNYSSVVHVPGPMKSTPVLNPRQNVVGKAKKVVMETPNFPRVEPAGPVQSQAEMNNEQKRFGRRGKK
jgi:hypothetical protein